MKRIYANEDACIGCRLCELYCQVEHSQSRDILRAFKRERALPPPRIRIHQAAESFVAVQCQHCPEPPCVYACLTGALRKDPVSGVVTVDSERCVGCWTCVMVCPFGAITPSLAEDIMVKCDLCPELEVPACVAGCPNRALLLLDDTKETGQTPAAVAAGERI